MIEREISITEAELGILIQLLDKEEKKCKAAAKATMQGYKKADSIEKYAKWLQRADDCLSLAEKLSERFL